MRRLDGKQGERTNSRGSVYGPLPLNDSGGMFPGSHSTGLVPAWLALALFFLPAALVLAQETPVSFQRDVQPILAEYCYQCHGPDQAQRQADLRLDIPDGLFSGPGRRGVVVPGKPESSELYRRIGSSDPDERMPPADTGKSVPPGAVETIRRWIERGAPWDGHWAFRPVRRPPLPPVRNRSWPRNPVDRFVLARLEAEGVSPSPPADPYTLVRRVSLDLTGLPLPWPLARQWATGTDPLAYEKLVDTLLASPHYGERMAVYWLDLVRYADSCGYHSDVEQPIAPYREYVIDALNEDMGFDQFTREQLAGDLLPNPTTRQLVASGYNRLNKTTEEGGAQAGEYLVKYAADRVRTTAGAWLGLTLGCAECHDHKYDPVPTEDFYRFAAFFADVKEQGVYGGGKREPELLVVRREDRLELEELEQAIAQVEKRRSGIAAGDGERGELERELQELQRRRKQILDRRLRTMITVSVSPAPHPRPSARQLAGLVGAPGGTGGPLVPASTSTHRYPG